MIQLSQSRKFKNMTQNQFEFLNDASMYYPYYKYRLNLDKDRPNCLSRLLFFMRGFCLKNQIGKMFCSKYIYNKFLGMINTKILIIYPDSWAKIMWDFGILVLLVLNIFYIPLKMSFSFHDDFSASKEISFFLESAPSWTFMMDILLNFNTAQYRKGELVTDRMQIAKNYIKGHFFWDFVIIVPFFFSSRLNIE